MNGNQAYAQARDAAHMANTLSDQPMNVAFVLPRLSDTIKAHTQGEKHADKKARRNGHDYAPKDTPRQRLQAWGLLAYADECRAKYQRRTRARQAMEAQHKRKSAAGELANVKCPRISIASLQNEAVHMRERARLAFARMVADKLDGYGRPSVAQRLYDFEYHTRDQLGDAPGPYFLLDYNGIVALAQAFGWTPPRDHLENHHTHNALNHERKVTK